MGNYYDNRQHYETLDKREEQTVRALVPRDLLWYFGVSKEST